MKLKEVSEDQIIESLKQFLPSKAYNEDAALIALPKNLRFPNVVMNVDVVTDQDDWLPGQSLHDLGFKIVMASASDLAAKGAQFIAAQSSLNMAASFELQDVVELVGGMHEACQLLGGTYLGGDFGTVTDGFVLSVNSIGYLADGCRYLSRRGMKEGDVIWVSGEFGWTGYGFSMVLHGKELDSRVRKAVLQKLHRPVARMSLGTKLARLEGITTSMDCSDGLARTLWILARENSARLVIKDLPLPETLKDLLPKEELMTHALHGGEEFELVFTARPHVHETLLALSRELALKLTPIGVVKEVGAIKGGMVDSNLPIPIKERGWDVIQRFNGS